MNTMKMLRLLAWSLRFLFDPNGARDEVAQAAKSGHPYC